MHFCSLFVHNGPPRCLCVPESASGSSWALSRLSLHTTTCSESRIRHPYTHEKHGIYFHKTVGICAALFSAITNHLPPTPYDTPHAAPCNKAEFRVRRRHAAGGVCEQRIGSTKNIYIHLFILIIILSALCATAH